MKVLVGSLLLIIFYSCEKVPEFNISEGYFEGAVNGEKLITGAFNNKYEPYIEYYKAFQCDVFGKGSLGLALSTSGISREDNLGTSFYIDPTRSLDGKKYTNFTYTRNFSESDCSKIPALTQSAYRSSDTYEYIVDKDDYLKINEVTDEYISGCFEVKFIRKLFRKRE